MNTDLNKDLKIAVAGTGYVGLSIATLLAQHHQVTAVDVIPEKVEMLNRKQSPIQDDYIEKYLADKPLNLTATLDGAAAYRDADFVVIAAPTNYDPIKNYFDTSHVEEVIDLVLEVNPQAVMVIKSTIPVGYCRSLYIKYMQKGVKRFNLLFSPEFLRESKALYDNLYPSQLDLPQLVIGDALHMVHHHQGAGDLLDRLIFPNHSASSPFSATAEICSSIWRTSWASIPCRRMRPRTSPSLQPWAIPSI